MAGRWGKRQIDKPATRVEIDNARKLAIRAVTATSIEGAGSLVDQDANNVEITGGTIGGVTISDSVLDDAVIDLAAGETYTINGTQVVGARGAAVSDPTGGATVDTESRAAIAAILARLRAHGLIAT